MCPDIVRADSFVPFPLTTRKATCVVTGEHQHPQYNLMKYDTESFGTEVCAAKNRQIEHHDSSVGLLARIARAGGARYGSSTTGHSDGVVVVQ